METRLNPNILNSKVTHYRIEGSMLTLMTGLSMQTYKRLSSAEIPSWLENELAKAYKVMDKKRSNQLILPTPLRSVADD